MTGCVLLKKAKKKYFFIFTIFATKSEQKLCSVDVFRLCKIREILGFRDLFRTLAYFTHLVPMATCGV